jgi:Ca-activated chloride channel family protein
MSFASPVYLWLLILVPGYVLVWIWQRNKGRAIRISNIQGYKKTNRLSLVNFFPWLQMLIASLTILLLVIAMARPQDELKLEEVKKNGIDIVLALDVSGSMMAEDLKPNRMEAAKESIGKFIGTRQDDRMGIVVFAGKAFTQSPLTFDYEILKEYLTQTSTETVNQRVRGLSGTAIGDAILAGVNRFDQEDAERNQVLIIATDGDANVGVDPKLAAQKAADEGVKIYTIGIGSEEGAYIPTTDVLGRKTWMTDETGQPIKAIFNEESLKEIAQIGKGEYFRAEDNNSFDKVLAQIDALEKSEVAVSSTTQFKDDHGGWLSASFLSFILLTWIWAIKPLVR